VNHTKNEHGHYVWPALYKTASKGKEQQWDICVVPLHGERGDIVVEHGQVGGKIQVAIVTVEKGKNLGKKNATTGKEQAVLEAQAKWLKQQDKGYSVERGGGSMELKPMLAHKYEDVKDIVFPAHIQPKLDGCRCLAYRESEDVVRLISRQGKDFGKWLGHIREALKHMMKVGDVFDGELYVHGVNFQTVLSWIKKDQPDTSKLEYHVYDRVSADGFLDRMLQTFPRIAGGSLASETTCIRTVDTDSVNSREEVQAKHEEYVAAGYEGAILRLGDCKYTQGYRSRQLLKVKSFMDAEFKCVDVVDGVGKCAGQGIYVLETDKGACFNAKPKGRDEVRFDLFTNKADYIGKMVTVTFFEWTTSETPIPRFPIAIGVRDYE
jgi:DNA ligase-1